MPENTPSVAPRHQSVDAGRWQPARPFRYPVRNGNGVVDEPPEPPSEPGPEAEDLHEFFEESSEQSAVKTRICVNYFFPWARIIIRKMRADRAAYIDFYAGPGRFLDGTKSTPLLVLETAISDSEMRDRLVTIFNDAAPEHTKSLKKAVDSLEGVGTLRHRPKIITGEVGSDLVGQLERPHIPTFAFIDPWGYKGLSLRLVNAVIKDWGCECLFFFNYNRINPAISNPSVRAHMEALFGRERLAALQAALARERLTPEQREAAVMKALTEALQELGGEYVIPFRFMAESSNRTSHYLVFVSKNFLGYEIMRDVMAKASSVIAPEGVASFEYTPRPGLFITDGRSINELAEMLVNDLAGRMITVRDVFEQHSPGRFYVERNYKDALLALEEAGRVTMLPPANERRRYRGKPSLRDDVRVTFPRLPGTGAKATASRSTPDRPASDLPPSGADRPIA
jgi:three-Cys-motif partner protein